MVELPECWTAEWLRKRPARIALRRGDGFRVQPRYEAANGRVVSLFMPRVMEAEEDGGHSLYAGQVCWDIAEDDSDLPIYLCEGDFVWLDDPPPAIARGWGDGRLV